MADTPKPKRKPGQPVTDAEKAQVRELIAAGRTHRQVMQEVGLASSTLSSIKKSLGLVTPIVNPGQRAGVEAYARNAAAKRMERQAGLDEMYRLREKRLLDALNGRAKYQTTLKGAMGVELEVELDFIPAADWRSEVQALANIDTAINRNDDRADDGGLARAQSMLAKVMEAVSGAELVPRPGLIEE